MTTTASATRSWHLGFESHADETSIDDLPVSGEVPQWLRGALIRTTPAAFEAGERRLNHWFDGFAMLHRFGFTGGRVSYVNRFLDTAAWRSARDGTIGYREFATDPCRSLFKKMTSVFRPEVTDNANVNIVRAAERFVAVTETPLQVEFDPQTLETVGVAEAPSAHLHTRTAHPHVDESTGEVISYGLKFSKTSTYKFFRSASSAEHFETIGSMKVRRPSYVHSVGLTKRFIVLVENPLVVDPLRLLVAGKPFIENFRWEPDRGSRFTLIDRRSGRVVLSERAMPFFSFHHVNAFEQGSDLTADLVVYDDASIVDRLRLDELRKGGALPQPRLERFTISSGGRITRRPVSEVALELPRINYSSCNGGSYRFVYGAGAHPTDFFDHLLKVDVTTGESLAWQQAGTHPGEPVFVARPGGAGEDDGVVLSVVLDVANESSFLLVLDAKTFAEVGRATVPHPINFGFHGSYYPDPAAGQA